jgi:hypothetical protein
MHIYVYINWQRFFEFVGHDYIIILQDNLKLIDLKKLLEKSDCNYFFKTEMTAFNGEKKYIFLFLKLH